MDRLALIEARLREALAPAHLRIHDESAAHAGHAGAKSGGGHYAVTVVSDRFSGCASLARHRLVYQALGDLMHRDIHALRIEALTPSEFTPSTSEDVS